jgi:hypothetical protein
MGRIQRVQDVVGGDWVRSDLQVIREVYRALVLNDYVVELGATTMPLE